MVGASIRLLSRLVAWTDCITSRQKRLNDGARAQRSSVRWALPSSMLCKDGHLRILSKNAYVPGGRLIRKQPRVGPQDERCGSKFA